MEMTDKEYTMLKNREPAMVKKLYDNYNRQIYNYIRSKVHGNDEAVDEIMQETFLSVLDSLSKLNHNKNILSWLIKIAFRRCCDYFRKLYKEKKTFESLDYEQKNNLQYDKEKKDDAMLTSFDIALDMINPKHREVLILKYKESKSLKEISKLLNTSESAIESHLYRARKILKQKMETILRDLQ